MDKSEILKSVIEQMKETFTNIVNTALEAKSAATSEESKAENKYDTRGLEASYLAGAQAERAAKLKKEINELEKFELKEFKKDDASAITSLIKVVMNEGAGKETNNETSKEQTRWFFILPYGGGSKIDFNNELIYVVSPISPIGQKLLGKSVDDYFEIKSVVYEIQTIS